MAAFTILSSSLKKYEEHLKALGPAGETELKRIQDAKGTLTKAQDSLQISPGKVVVAALPVIDSFTNMARGLAAIAGGVAAVVQQATRLPGVGTAVKWGTKFLPWGALPAAAGFAADAADWNPSSLPGLSVQNTGFPAEFLLVVAALGTHTGAGIAALFGMVIGAAYTLTMYRRAFLGPVTNPAIAQASDLRPAELAVALGFALLILAVGLFPSLFLDLIAPAADAWLRAAR